MVRIFNSSTKARRFANRMTRVNRFICLSSWLDLFGDKVFYVVYR